MYVTWQLAEVLLAESVQELALKLPAPSLVKLAVPAGAVRPLGAVSDTVAMQVAGWPFGTGFGEQLTLVAVVCFVAVGEIGCQSGDPSVAAFWVRFVAPVPSLWME